MFTRMKVSLAAMLDGLCSKVKPHHKYLATTVLFPSQDHEEVHAAGDAQIVAEDDEDAESVAEQPGQVGEQTNRQFTTLHYQTPHALCSGHDERIYPISHPKQVHSLGPSTHSPFHTNKRTIPTSTVPSATMTVARFAPLSPFTAHLCYV